MVVGQAPIIYTSAVSPIQFPSRICPMPATAQTPPSTTMNSPTIISQFQYPLTPPSSPGSSPVLSPIAPINVNSNSIFSYSHIPTNFYSSVSVMPMCYKTDNQVSPSAQNILSCSPVYTGTQSIAPSSIIPCQPRIVNGTVLHCTPGLCPYSMADMTPLSNISYSSTNQVYIPPSITQSICSTNVVSPWKQSYGMEQVWRKEFSNLFYNYTRHSQHIWTLLPVTDRPGGVWYENVDSAKVRFCCDVCGHGWTSMKGRVAFWFILNYATNEGVVCLKLYGQQCDRCKRGDYEPAMWYPEEVIKVIVNIYNRVGQVYYGFEQAPYHKTRRPGKPRTPHNSDLCQACKDGVCAERR